MVASAPIHTFLGFFLPVLRTFCQTNCLLCHMTIVRTIDSGERGMNLLAMTDILPVKEN